MTQDEILQNTAGVMIKTTLVDFPGKVACSYFMRGCNLRCPYCYNADLVKSNSSLDNSQDDSDRTHLVTPITILEHLFKRKQLINGLVISGGEPLLNPATPILIKAAKQMGMAIKLDTNGTLPDALESLMSNPETCPDFIAMDIKTSPDRYAEKMGVTAGFAQKDIPSLLKRSVDLISSLGPDNYEIRTVLVPGLTELEDIKNIAQMLPQDASWQFAQFRNENCIDPSYNEIQPFIDAKLKELTDYAKTFIPKAALR